MEHDQSHRDSVPHEESLPQVASHAAPPYNAQINDKSDAASLIATNRRAKTSEVIPVDDEHPPVPPAYKDIGALTDSVEGKDIRDGLVHKSQRQMILQEIRNDIGSRQVTFSALQFCPDWILDHGLTSGLSFNWKGAYITVPEVSIPHGANLISSHIVFKIKDDDGNLRLKARLVLD